MDGLSFRADAFNREAAHRVPLAEATLLGFAFLTDSDFLARVYERFRGRCFEADLSFKILVNLISDALLMHRGSLLPAVEAAIKNQEFAGSPQGVYGKLGRCSQSLSQGFLSEGAARLMDVMNPPPSPVPISLQTFEVLVIDGKKIKNVAKRLKPTRSFRGAVLGGKVLVALDLATGLIRFMSSHEDGETNDVPLVPPLLKQLRGAPCEQPRLVVLDSQFCDLGLPRLFEDNGLFYVIRWSLKTSFTRDEQREVKLGFDKEGRKYQDEWGWMGAQSDKRRRYVRRVTLFRPGEEDVIIFTNLLDETTYPPGDLLELYRERWTLENVFQQITEVFHLQHLISCSPKGTIFQCAFCLMMYNMLVLQRSYIVNSSPSEPEPAAATPEPSAEKEIPAPTEKQPAVKKQTPRTANSQPIDTVPPRITLKMFSMEKYFKDVTEELIAWHKMIPLSWTLNYFATPLTATEMRQRLQGLLHGRWDPKWLKSPKKKYRAKTLDPPKPGGHTSVYRLIYGDPRTKAV